MSNYTDLVDLLKQWKSKSKDTAFQKKVLDKIAAVLVDLGAT